MEIPKINTDFLYSKSPIDYDAMQKVLEDLEPSANYKILEELQQLRFEKQNRSWVERNTVVFSVIIALIGAVLGVLGTLLVEYLKVHHMLGL
jgi:hypothetical protein